MRKAHVSDREIISSTIAENDLLMGMLDEAANNIAPAFPLTSREMSPRNCPPVPKKVAVIGSTSDRLGCASKPNTCTAELKFIWPI